MNSYQLGVVGKSQTNFSIRSQSMRGPDEVEKERCSGWWPALTDDGGCLDLSLIRKYLLSVKYNSPIGKFWDLLQVALSLLACAIYVAERYQDSYYSIQVYVIIEDVITQFFLVDFLLNWFISSSTVTFFKSAIAWIDIVTILPTYLMYIPHAPNVSWLRFVTILRLIRILRIFRLLGGFSGVKRQLVTLMLALVSLTFVAAGIINLTENDVNELHYDCQYISKKTNYEPSCDADFSSYNDPTCDCKEKNCYALHDIHDRQHEPSKIRCRSLGFFEGLYFVVVTISVVGYGDFMPTNDASRVATLMLIVTALIVIPMQINKLQTLLAMNSPFRTTYNARPHESHIIICGHVNDKWRLSRIFREFFHPDRYAANTPELHLVILCPTEPTEDVKDLIFSPLFDSRVSYVIGSALNMEDLQKVRADVASGMFFLSNVEVDEEDAVLDDAATVLRTLSVNNFTTRLDCLVQVLRSQDRDLLKDSDADFVLCLDEYKTTLQCRNAICPGLATLVENLFHSFSSTCGKYSAHKIGDNWLSEYTYGVGMELYYVPIDHSFFSMLGFSWPLLVEAIFLEFECTLVGVYCEEDQSFCYNPKQYERKKFSSAPAFFKKFNVGVLLAPNNAVASAIGYAMTDTVLMDRMLTNMVVAEDQFAVRKHKDVNTEPTTELVRIVSSSSMTSSFSHHLKAILQMGQAQGRIENDFATARKRDTVLSRGGDDTISGFDTDSSEENDENFLGYVDNPANQKTMPQPRLGAAVATHSTSTEDSRDTEMLRKFSLQSVAESSRSTSHRSLFRTPTSSRELNSFSPDQTLSRNNSFKSLPNETSEILELLDDDDTPQMRDMRDLSLVSKKAVLQMKASAGKVTNMNSMKNMIVKKNKLKSLKHAASLVRAVKSQKHESVGNGAKGKFASIARRAALQQMSGEDDTMSIPAATKPASIMTALQQTRLNSVTKRKGRKSMKDVASMARMAAVMNGPTSSQSPPKGSSPLESKNKKLPLDDQIEQSQSIAALVSKFQAENEEKRKLRRVLSTRVSSVHEDDASAEAMKKSPSRSALGRSESGAGEIIQSSNAQSAPVGSGVARRVASVMRSPPAVNRRRRGSLNTAFPSLEADGSAEINASQRFGVPSEEIDDAADLSGHVIVFGCMDHILLFVSELRKELVVDDAYHQILIVNPGEPRKWRQIQSRYDDVFFLDSNVSSNQELTLMNVRAAYALVLLASRERINVDETFNVDADAIFMYLKMERFVPRDVFFTVELSCPNNMGVLNSAIVRRSKIERDINSQGPLWGDAGTGLASCLKGSYKFRNSINIDVLLGQMKTEVAFEKYKGTVQLTSGKFSRHRQSTAIHLSPSSPVHGQGQGKGPEVMRMSSVTALSRSEANTKKNEQQKIQTGNCWGVDDTHHILPIFAAGRAVVPSSFDSMLCQSFFGTVAPQLCEKLVCGQDTQMLYHVPIPSTFFGRKYKDMFRALNSRGLLPLALYRTPLPRNEGILPYVFTNPPVETTVNGDDRVLVFGNPDTIRSAFTKLGIPLVRRNGKMALGEDISSVTRPQKKTPTASEYRPLGAKHQFTEHKDAVCDIPDASISLKPGGESIFKGTSRVHPTDHWASAVPDSPRKDQMKSDPDLTFPDPTSFRDS
eukprot:CAMPEP_0185018052 /NCGR_PEP_ID=MMETSP1103-20130426/903_1 /TAXON_ID=36769 /ORGANISM="Paraphysomonas bandaiensis, Strain Caron Lab Isolate" /LENGTH=1629 /DNA_ID=CAMNT_0027547741 /DNA_START=137 /DNA_END=5026 /DNA_ORIENTATION=-